jgi:hypothetical protein
MKGRNKMENKLIAHLEAEGYTFVSINTQESTETVLRAFGEDSRGFYLEFQYTPSDGFLMDRAVGSKYWDITGKVAL